LSLIRDRRSSQADLARPGLSGPHDDAVTDALRGLFGRDTTYLLVWALQLIVAAAATPVITRVLGAPEFGRVAAANAVMQILFILAGLGLRTAIQRWYAADEGPAAAARLLALTVVVSTLVTVVADLTGPVWSPYLGFDDYGGALRLAVFWAGISAVTNASLALLRSQDRLLAFSTVSLIQSVLAEAASLVLVMLVSRTAATYVGGQLLMQITAAVLALALAPPKLLRRTDRTLVTAALRYALPLVPAVLCTFVLATSDRLIVQSFLGETAVARYQIAYNVGAMPILLLGVLSNTWMPRIFALGVPEERAGVLVASRDALNRLVVPVVIGLCLGVPLLLRIWAPPEYGPDTLLLVTTVVVVSAIPYTIGLSHTRTLLAEGRTVAIAVSNAVAAVANVGLNLILVPRYGLVGAAAATLVAYVTLQAMQAVTARAAISLPRSPVWLSAQLLGAAVGGLLAGALPTTPTWLAVRIVLAAGCLAWFGWILFRLSRPRPGADGPSTAALATGPPGGLT
jgi:O-antigen/teichoic acid export membrane protein